MMDLFMMIFMFGISGNFKVVLVLYLMVMFVGCSFIECFGFIE